MPTVETRHFGVKEYAEDSLVRMPRGLPGFEDANAFLVLQLPDQYPLVYLQSVIHPDLCFVALPVLSVEHTYDLQLSEEDSRLLGTPVRPRIGADALCLALIAASKESATVNLLAPVVINLATNIAAQCLNTSGDYSHQRSLFSAEEALTA